MSIKANDDPTVYVAGTPEPATDPLQMMADALAPLTPSSSSATVRTALLNLKAAVGEAVTPPDQP